MATLFGDNSTKRTQNVPAEKVKVKEEHGRIRVAYDEITFSAALSSADVIVLAKIPKGAKVYDVVVSVDTVMGGSVDADIGWGAGVNGDEAADPNGFGSAVDLNTLVPQKMEGDDPGYAKEFDDEVEIQILMNDAVAGASGIVMRCYALYAID